MIFVRHKITIAFALAAMLVPGASARAAEPAVNTLTASEKAAGWKLLFDGKNLDGWRNYRSESVSDGWSVKDGSLVRGNKAGDLITDEQYKYFDLSLEYKISEAGNSGLMFHVTEDGGTPWMTGPEIQIQDNAAGHDPQKSGWLYQLYKPVTAKWLNESPIRDSTRPAGQWNQIYLRIAPSTCEVCMNGLIYYHFDLKSDEWKQRISNSKFADFANFGTTGKGHICLQDHGDKVEFRNIKLRPIADDGSVQRPIDGKLAVQPVLAFPNLKWDQWEPMDESGKLQPLRLLELTFARDQPNRMYTISQRGEIWTFENRADVSESSLFLDLTEQVVDFNKGGANEQGLLGLAMHPEFGDNGYFFTYHSDPKTGASIVTRWSRDASNPLVADPDSGVQVIAIDEPFQNHNGGSIEFGPDGHLYIAVGDGGSANDPNRNGQDKSTLLGSILRIDVDHPADGKEYGIPADNPFVDEPNARPEIFAYGMRNPWRIAFDPSGGTLWAADVGQELWEEIDVIQRGGNYGWNIREGMHPFSSQVADASNTIDPIWEYDHQQGKSITGGRVYRGKSMPDLVGKYIYADYVTGTMWALTADVESNRAIRNEELLPDAAPVLGFGQDAAGEVYYMVTDPRGQCIYKLTKPEKVASR